MGTSNNNFSWKIKCFLTYYVFRDFINRMPDLRRIIRGPLTLTVRNEAASPSFCAIVAGLGFALPLAILSFTGCNSDYHVNLSNGYTLVRCNSHNIAIYYDGDEEVSRKVFIRESPQPETWGMIVPPKISNYDTCGSVVFGHNCQDEGK